VNGSLNITKMMKAVPVLKCRHMQRSLAFYTGILDFSVASSFSTPDDLYHWCSLMRGESEIHLSTFPGDGVFGSVVYFRVTNIDSLFKFYCSRGLDPSHKPESPAHQRPVDQTWGMREFFIDDPDGNVLRFGEPVSI
jgi:catechol 2,3-dioxygenase-like lactoylglutathione lyase family enzyme